MSTQIATGRTYAPPSTKRWAPWLAGAAAAIVAVAAIAVSWPTGTDVATGQAVASPRFRGSDASLDPDVPLIAGSAAGVALAPRFRGADAGLDSDSTASPGAPAAPGHSYDVGTIGPAAGAVAPSPRYRGSDAALDPDGFAAPVAVGAGLTAGLQADADRITELAARIEATGINPSAFPRLSRADQATADRLAGLAALLGTSAPTIGTALSAGVYDPNLGTWVPLVAATPSPSPAAERSPQQPQ